MQKAIISFIINNFWHTYYIWQTMANIVVEVTKMSFEKGDNYEAYQLDKAESTSVDRSKPILWLPICCPWIWKRIGTMNTRAQ